MTCILFLNNVLRGLISLQTSEYMYLRRCINIYQFIPSASTGRNLQMCQQKHFTTFSNDNLSGGKISHLRYNVQSNHWFRVSRKDFLSAASTIICNYTYLTTSYFNCWSEASISVPIKRRIHSDCLENPKNYLKGLPRHLKVIQVSWSSIFSVSSLLIFITPPPVNVEFWSYRRKSWYFHSTCAQAPICWC